MLKSPIMLLGILHHADTINPTVNDDQTQGFDYNSHWINTTTNELFVCFDPSTGAADWREVGVSGGGGGVTVETRDPNVNDDNTLGHDPGDLWFNTTNETVWWCKSAATGAAVWLNTTQAVASKDNQNMAAQTTTSDQDLACATAIAHTPAGDGLVEVRVNGHTVHVGDGSKVADCYFSGDGGTNVRNMAAVELGDLLYWMGSIAKHELSSTKDKISFVYPA